MKNKILTLSIIFVIVAGMFSFATNVNAVTDIKISGNSVWRSNETTATIKFISDTAGTAYYKITSSNVAPTTTDFMTNGTDGGSVTADSTKNISLTGLTSGAKYVHIIVENGDSLSNVLTMEIPYNYYYSENFESYNGGTYISSGSLSPIEQVNNGTGNTNQKVVSQTENNILSLSSSSGWASDQVIKLDSTKLSTASKYVLEGKVYVPIDTTGWRARFGFTNGTYGGTNCEVGVYFKNGSIVYNGNDSASILLNNYEANKWYNIKIEVSPSTSKYFIYIDGVLKGNELPLLASNVNRIAFTSGHGYTALYDDFKFYAMSTPTTNIVTFNTNGGSTVVNQTIANGETATLPTLPTKDNYEFGGWYADEELTTPFDFTTAITGPITIYAKWNVKPFNMTGIWNINIPSNGTAFTGTVNITEQTGTSFIGIFQVNSESNTNIVNGQIIGNNVTFDRDIGSRYQNYSGTLDVSTGTATIIGNFNDTYSTFKMTKTLPIITGNSVWRSNGTTANINFISNTTGTVYYKITDSSTLPVDIVTGETSGGNIIANTTTNISLTGLTSGAKYVHIVVKNGDSLSNALTIALPYDVYYFDDFESYSDNTYPKFFNMRYNGGSTANQKIITLNENKVFNAYGTYGTGLDERIRIEPLSTGYAVFETDISAASLSGNNWYFGGIVVGPNYDNDNRNMCVQIHHETKKFVSGENNRNHISDIVFETNKNYHVKIVLDVENHKFDYYINNVKANEVPINIAASYYTSLNWFGIYSGSGTVYYDNMRFYATNTAPISTYTVTFNTNGGSEVASQTITSGATVTEPETDPTKANYTFVGWYSDPALTTAFDFTTAITADTTIYAKWAINEYTVTFNTNGGSEVASQTITHGATVTELETDPIKTNYTFEGWYADATLTTLFDFTTVITADITIYAKWAINEYTVTFNTNGGSEVASQTITHGATVTELETDPTKTNYTFEGWYADATLTTLFDFTTVITADITIYAKWAINEYTVTFNTNGGSEIASQTITHGATVTEPETDPTKANYTFVGWYSDLALTTAFDFTTAIIGPTTIYAKWNPIPTYTVTFNTNGGSTVANQTIISGETLALPTLPTKVNYTFVGWYADETLTTAFDFTTAITADTTIYAKWKEVFSEKIITKTEDAMTASVKGIFSGEPVLVITKTESGNKGYNSLVTLVKEDKEVIGSYDVSITGGTYEGELELTFTVGKQYEGDKITIYHKKANGEVETLTAIVKDGKVVITVSELSPFMLVADKEVVEQKDATPKTGDNVYLYIILVTITLAGVLVTSKLMKKNR